MSDDVDELDDFVDDEGELRDWTDIQSDDEPDDDVDVLEPVDVGDHVEDREKPDGERPTMVVLETPLDKTSATYTANGKTIDEYSGNDDYRDDDDVVVCKYASRTDVKLTDGRKFAFPRSRVVVVSRVHDRDENTSDTENDD